MKKVFVFLIYYVYSFAKSKYFRFTTNTFVFVFLRFMEIITESRDHGLRIFVLKSFLLFQNHKLCHCSQIFLFLFEKLSGSSMLMEGVARNFKLDFGFDQIMKKNSRNVAARDD